MARTGSTRRVFIQRTIAASATIAAGSRLRAADQPAGANERIRIGLIGCGGRARFHLNWIAENRKQHPAAVVAACDIWKQNREAAAKAIQDTFAIQPEQYKDYRELLANKDIDAVVISTPDHQHCTQLRDAVAAGKDVYVEKPIAMELDDLNKTLDAVKASRCIVQHGTQGRSCSGAASARDFIQAGKLGKVLRFEESRSFYTPYWNFYTGQINEQDTDWKAFLFNRPDRPFDSDQHRAWMGYRDFSSGTVGGWMSHFSDLIHYMTGCGFPKYAVAHGGIFSPTSKKERTCPDTITAVLEYPEGFTTCYMTHFGNGANDYVLGFGTKGTMRLGPPDGHPNGIEPRVSPEGSDDPDKVKEAAALPNELIENHMANWLRCIRERQQPAANMDAGYKHGIAAILADRAFVEGRRMTFDPAKREIRPA